MIIILDVNIDDVVTVINLIGNVVKIDAIIITGVWCNPGVGAANLLDILCYLKANDIPVFVGSLTTVNRESVDLESLYFIDTLWNTMQEIPRKKHALPTPGTSYVDYVKSLRKYDKQIDVLCFSAFRDLVPLLDLDVIGDIYALGSNTADDYTGPVSDTKHSNAQSNIYVDPEAALITLVKAHPKVHWLDNSLARAIPINEITVANVKRVFKEKYGSNYSSTVKGRCCFLIYKLLKNMVESDPNDQIYLWDYTVALTLLSPELFDSQHINLLINADQSSDIVRTDTQTIVTEVFSNSLGQFTILPPNSNIGYLTNYIFAANQSGIRDKFIESL